MTKLDQLLAEILDESETLGSETPFAESGSWDSLKHVELVVGIEGRYGVDLSAEEIGRLTCKRAALEVLAARGLDG